MGVHVLFIDNLRDLRRIIRLARRKRLQLINAVVVIYADNGRLIGGLIRQSDGGITVLKQPIIKPATSR